MEQKVFLTNGSGKTGHAHEKKSDTNFIFFTKSTFKCIIEANVECKTIKLLEDNIGENLDHIGYGDNF